MVSAQASFLRRGRLLDLAGSGGIVDAHAGIDFSHENVYVCFKRLFESYNKFPLACELNLVESGRVKHARTAFKPGPEVRADGRNAQHVNDLCADAIKSELGEQYRPAASRLIRVYVPACPEKQQKRSIGLTRLQLLRQCG